MTACFLPQDAFSRADPSGSNGEEFPPPLEPWMECVLQNWLFLHSLFLHPHISYHSPGLQTDWKDLQVDIHLNQAVCSSCITKQKNIKFFLDVGIPHLRFENDLKFLKTI